MNQEQNQQQIVQAVRASMRDVSLIVTRLAADATLTEPAGFQQHCMAVLDRLDNALAQQGAAPQEREDAVYAASCLLDEAALQKLAEPARSRWQATPLQVSRFGNLQGGELVYEQIAGELAKPAPSYWRLACWQLVLGLGFQGKYGVHDHLQRHQLLNRIDERLAPVIPAETAPPPPAAVIHWRSFSPLLWAVLAWSASALLYVVLQGWLKNAVTALAH